MISDKMTKALNGQINAEMYSAYLYLSMSSYASVSGLPGAASWLMAQAQEEMSHAQRFYNYVIRQGAQVVLDAIEKPPTTFKSLTDIFEKTLAHEQKVTALINGLVDLAIEEHDHATNAALQWFVNEQVEEEESANDVLSQLKLIGNDGQAQLLIDRELGQRIPVALPGLAPSVSAE